VKIVNEYQSVSCEIIHVNKVLIFFILRLKVGYIERARTPKVNLGGITIEYVPEVLDDLDHSIYARGFDDGLHEGIVSLMIC
jgi:hypothetical protein